jgi:hypothetical protein
LLSGRALFATEKQKRECDDDGEGNSDDKARERAQLPPMLCNWKPKAPGQPEIALSMGERA